MKNQISKGAWLSIHICHVDLKVLDMFVLPSYRLINQFMVITYTKKLSTFTDKLDRSIAQKHGIYAELAKKNNIMKQLRVYLT